MFKKLHRVKNIEEVLGALGICYLLILITAMVFLIRFFALKLKESFDVSAVSKPEVAAFDFNAVPQEFIEPQ